MTGQNAHPGTGEGAQMSFKIDHMGSKSIARGYHILSKSQSWEYTSLTITFA